MYPIISEIIIIIITISISYGFGHMVHTSAHTHIAPSDAVLDVLYTFIIYTVGVCLCRELHSIVITSS